MSSRTLIAVTTLLLLTRAAGCRDCERDGKQRSVVLATTTSTYDSGLLDVLVPAFEEESGYVVKTIAVGSGQAMAMGRRGEVDVLLVHSPEDEEAFIEEGHGIHRRRVMHNDFVIVGPSGDPAGIRRARDAADAMRAIARAAALFVSRGDDSGTHRKETRLWKEAGESPSGREWYVETGTGMGNTLQVASEKSAYTITDRGTFLALGDTLHLEVLVEGDPVLHNVYHVIEANPERHPDVNAGGARAFADFMLSEEAQRIIETFGTDEYASPLFFPDALD